MFNFTMNDRYSFNLYFDDQAESLLDEIALVINDTIR